MISEDAKIPNHKKSLINLITVILRKISPSKDMVKSMEREAKNWEKIFAACITKKKHCYPEYTKSSHQS